MKSRVIDSKYGQIEVPRDHGAPAIVNSRMADGHSPLMRGTEVLIFDKDEDKTLFIVREATPNALADAATQLTAETSTQSETTTTNSTTTRICHINLL